MNAFEAGKSYSCRSICDSDCIFTFAVKSRTASTVTIQGHGRTTRRKIYKSADGAEYVFPLGQYSMCPVIRASWAA